MIRSFDFSNCRFLGFGDSHSRQIGAKEECIVCSYSQISSKCRYFDN